MMRALRGPLLVLGAAALLLAAGCKSLSCNNPDSYSNALEVQTLKMPVGLDGPDTSQALKVPALKEPEVPHDPNGPCLEEPPVFVPPRTTTTSAPASPASAPARTAPERGSSPLPGPKR